MAVFIALNGLSNKTLATQWVAVACVIIFQFLTGFGWMGCPWLVSILTKVDCSWSTGPLQLADQ